MGLIKAASEVIGAVSGALGTTANAIWTDYFESGDMTGVIMTVPAMTTSLPPAPASMSRKTSA